MEITYLLDTNIIIYHLNGDEPASSFIDSNFDKSAISFITYIEVLSFPFETEEVEAQVRQLLNSFEKLPMRSDTEEETIRIKKLRKIKLPDALIAAIAKTENLKLVTRNTKDFNGLGIQLVNPFDK